MRYQERHSNAGKSIASFCKYSFVLARNDEQTSLPDLSAVANALAAAGIRLADAVIGREAHVAADFCRILDLGTLLYYPSHKEIGVQMGIHLERHLPRLVDKQYLVFLTVCMDEDGDVLYRDIQIDLQTLEARAWIARQDFPIPYEQLPHRYRFRPLPPYLSYAGAKIKLPGDVTAAGVGDPLQMRPWIATVDRYAPRSRWSLGGEREVQILELPDYRTGVSLGKCRCLLAWRRIAFDMIGRSRFLSCWAKSGLLRLTCHRWRRCWPRCNPGSGLVSPITCRQIRRPVWPVISPTCWNWAK